MPLPFILGDGFSKVIYFITLGVFSMTQFLTFFGLLYIKINCFTVYFYKRISNIFFKSMSTEIRKKTAAEDKHSKSLKIRTIGHYP